MVKMTKREIVTQMTYSGDPNGETFVDSWEDTDGWPEESRIELHSIGGKDYYIAIDTSGSDKGFGAGVVAVETSYDAADNALKQEYAHSLGN